MATTLGANLHDRVDMIHSGTVNVLHAELAFRAPIHGQVLLPGWLHSPVRQAVA